MVNISNVKVYDLKESVIASGNAMRITPVEYTEEEFQKGLKRMIKLVSASREGNIKCHDNALTGIRVSFDITYPQYISPELQRYHWIDIITSSSKMHRLCKMDVNKCCNKYVTEDTRKELQKHIDRYNRIANISPSEDVVVNMHLEHSKYEAFMEMISNCPMGLELFMRISTNYKQLQTIYYQRKNHRLKEDWGAIIKMIESLPYFNELILGNAI